jgi:hypothetical protein
VGDGTADAISRTGYQGCLARGVEWSVRQAHVDRSSDCDNCNVLRSSMSSTVIRFAIPVTSHPGLRCAPSGLQFDATTPNAVHAPPHIATAAKPPKRTHQQVSMRGLRERPTPQ